ncbi:MAG: hypothetical protein ABI640_06645 [Gammaproteobacteria bacterium]
MNRRYRGRSVQSSMWQPRLAHLLATAVFFSNLVLAQSSSGGAAVCPLSDSQTDASIKAFAKIVPTLTQEPRCVNCHGGVNPFMDGFGKDPSPGEDDIVPSLAEHGGGKMDRRVPPSATDPKGSPQTACNGCHNNMAHKIPSGAESEWALAPAFLAFLGKDAPTLCKQIKDFSRRCEGGICGPWPDAKAVLDHFTRDEGKDNFTGTAFRGDRGLDREAYPETEVPTEPPRNITAAGLVALVKEWIDTTGGEFKGDKSCGCEPAHYLIRVSTVNETNSGILHRTSVMPPVDVPITFKDDGTFSGDGTAKFQASGTALVCSGQSTSTLGFHVSGQAIETAEEQSMRFKFENSSPTVTNSSVRCPVIGEQGSQNVTKGQVAIPFNFTGDVGETFDSHMPVAIPGHTSTMHVEIVKKE